MCAWTRVSVYLFRQGVIAGLSCTLFRLKWVQKLPGAQELLIFCHIKLRNSPYFVFCNAVQNYLFRVKFEIFYIYTRILNINLYISNRIQTRVYVSIFIYRYWYMQIKMYIVLCNFDMNIWYNQIRVWRFIKF